MFQNIEMLFPVRDLFISIILVRLVGCSLQFSAALLIIQAGIYEACINDLYFPTLNRTRVPIHPEKQH
jgi:hypothetical protein